MHIGRSHHSIGQAIVAAIGGFIASFLTFISAPIMTSPAFRGQLIAGDRGANTNLPTTLSAFQSVTDGTNPLVQSMSSYGWWIMVIIGGLIASYVILKIMRRYA